MKRFFYYWAMIVSSKRGSKMIIGCWLLGIIALTLFAPGAKQYAVNAGEGSIHGNTPSAEAKALLNEQFPSDEGLTALLVFHGKSAITPTERVQIAAVSAWLSSENKPSHVASAMPFHQFPVDVQDRLFSEDGSTIMFNVALEQGIESDKIHETLEQIRAYVMQAHIGQLQFEITGPAGIMADTINLFKNADLVLLFSTIVLILVILMVIYRSPLLATIPLVIAAIVYQASDRILGLAAQNSWIVVDKQALSIMMILLFAVLTDYSLFIVARYREELKKFGSKHDAMKVAMSQVAEPILFSGGTVLIAVFALFIAIFEPYHNFAPVFSIAIAVILLGGLTLIPAVFTLVGRKAFWPSVPSLGETKSSTHGFWHRVGTFVTKKPVFVSSVILIGMLLAALNTTNIHYSFNLLKSFPDHISSRVGFELLEKNFPKGQLAPVTVLLYADKDLEENDSKSSNMTKLVEIIRNDDGISDIKVLPQSKKAIHLQMTLIDNPFEQSALDVIERMQDRSTTMLRESGLDPAHYSLHFAGQTAEQLDVRNLNQRDTVILFTLIAGLISVMLLFQSRSIVIALTMMGTMLLSYAAALGISWLIFSQIFGYDAVSYRLPVYTFVFLIALGVDYNIMLMSRIREEARKLPWKDAIMRGVAKTGGVISSAGIILAATFAVLMTQPLQELFLFGFIMAIGILMDTFIVRGMLLPALLAMIKGYKKHEQSGGI